MDESGIRFNDCFFGEPVPFLNWTPPGCASLYAILATDPNWAPRPFQPLYFGEFGNKTSLTAVQREVANLVPAPRRETLFIAVLPLPFSTTGQRLIVRNELIWAYNPPCPVAAPAPPPHRLPAAGRRGGFRRSDDPEIGRDSRVIFEFARDLRSAGSK